MENNRNNTASGREPAPVLYDFMKSKQFVATNHEEFVQQMRKHAYIPEEDMHTYMAQFAKRVWIVFQYSVRCDTPENFVNDLIRYGIVHVFLLN